MNSNFEDKASWYDTNLTYQPSPKFNSQLLTDRSITLTNKQNVIPCGAQLQTFISTLNQKKYQLKGLMIEKQKLNQVTIEQQTKIQAENIKQNYQVQREMELHRMNKRVLQDVQSMKKQKLKNMEKMLSIKKCLESRFEQIVQMKNLLTGLKAQGNNLQQRIQQTCQINMNVQNQIDSLDLMNQNLDNEVFHMKQTLRQTQVHKTTVQSALAMFKAKVQSTLNDIKGQNKQTRQMNCLMTQLNDKIKKRRQQKTENDILSHETKIRNAQIEQINIKLRNDLEKCKSHLQCVLKNNQVLQNSIQQFTYIDEKVTKLIHRNQLKKL